MSFKDMAERVKKRAMELREGVRGTFNGLEESLPHPLMNRKTILLREPLIKRLQRRRS
jgi:hypothetical protein